MCTLISDKWLFWNWFGNTNRKLKWTESRAIVLCYTVLAKQKYIFFKTNFPTVVWKSGFNEEFLSLLVRTQYLPQIFTISTFLIHRQAPYLLHTHTNPTSTPPRHRHTLHILNRTMALLASSSQAENKVPRWSGGWPCGFGNRIGWISGRVGIPNQQQVVSGTRMWERLQLFLSKYSTRWTNTIWADRVRWQTLASCLSSEHQNKCCTPTEIDC